jgi:hypothetical protein
MARGCRPPPTPKLGLYFSRPPGWPDPETNLKAVFGTPPAERRPGVTGSLLLRLAAAAGRACLPTAAERMEAVRGALRGVDGVRRRKRGEEEGGGEEAAAEGGVVEDGGVGGDEGADGGSEGVRRKRAGLESDMEAVVEVEELLACEEGRRLLTRYAYYTLLLVYAYCTICLHRTVCTLTTLCP